MTECEKYQGDSGGRGIMVEGELGVGGTKNNKGQRYPCPWRIRAHLCKSHDPIIRIIRIV